MKFPFVSRSQHEETVKALKKQITGLAKLLYPDGVPEEFQLLLGIHIEARADAPPREPELTEDQKAVAEMKAEQARDRANLDRIKRLRPSQLGQALTTYMEKWGSASRFTANVKPATASPAMELFAKAEREALGQIPEA